MEETKLDIMCAILREAFIKKQQKVNKIFKIPSSGHGHAFWCASLPVLFT